MSAARPAVRQAVDRAALAMNRFLDGEPVVDRAPMHEKEMSATMKRWTAWAAAMGVTLLLLGCGRYGCGPGEGWERGWGPMMFPGGGMFMVGMIPLIILVVAVVWWLMKGARDRDRGVPQKENPIDILKRRYAAGEITKEQFESMKKDLDG
jgi:putative membrane protein